MRSLAVILAGSAAITLGGCDPAEQPADKMPAAASDPVLEAPLRTGEAHPSAVKRSR